MRTYSLALLLLFLIATPVSGQQEVMDSLKLRLKNSASDSEKCIILSRLIEIEYDDKIWPLYNEQLESIARKNIETKNENLKTFFLDILSDALSNYCYLELNHRGDVNKAISYIHQSLEIDTRINNMDGVANSYNSLGVIYNGQGDIQKAIEYYKKALAIMEKSNNSNGIANAFGNLGIIYAEQKDYDTALEYFTKSLKLKQSLADKNGTANMLNSIGSIYEKTDRLSEALDHYYSALAIVEKTGDKIGIGATLNNIGKLYMEKGDPNCGLSKKECAAQGTIKAREYFKKAILIKEETGEQDGLAITLCNLGFAEYALGNMKESKLHAKRAFAISKEIGYPKNISNSARLLYQVEQNSGNWKDALEYYKIYIHMRDSIDNDQNNRAAIKQQIQYKYEKQSAIEQAHHEKELGIAAEREQKQKVIIAAVGIGLALTFFLAIFIFNRLRLSNRQKKIIESQKTEVESQKDIIEEKQKAILDSINYARRIQRALLPSEKYVAKNIERLNSPGQKASGQG